MNWYYLNKERQQFGPLSEGEFLKLVRSGAVTSDMLGTVSASEFMDWDISLPDCTTSSRKDVTVDMAISRSFRKFRLSLFAAAVTCVILSMLELIPSRLVAMFSRAA